MFISGFMVIEVSTFCYMWLDFIIIIPLTILIGNIHRKKQLTTSLPSDSILALESCLSFFITMIFYVICCIIAMIIAPYMQGYMVPRAVRSQRAPEPTKEFFETAVSFILNC